MYISQLMMNLEKLIAEHGDLYMIHMNNDMPYYVHDAVHKRMESNGFQKDVAVDYTAAFSEEDL